MKIGFCAGWDRLEDVARAGFDYMEATVTGIAGMSAEEFAQTLEKKEKTGLPVTRFNVLFPGTFRLLDGTGEEEIRKYLDAAFTRVKALGGEVVVFGSGGARKRPETLSYGDAFRKLVQVSTWIADMAQHHDLVIALEPLNRTETNTVNSVAEGADLCAAVAHPHFQLLADYYHIAKEQEKPSDVERVGGIRHCHIAALEGRRIPLDPMEGYSELFRAMKKTGYEGTISIEGRCDDLALQGPVAIRMLKQLWEET